MHDAQALIGIEVPALRSFANPLQPRVPLAIVVDATNATLTTAAVAGIKASYWRGLAERGDVVGTGPGLRIDRLYNPDARADWTFLPALIGVTMMIAMVMLGSLSLAREREGGTWEALLGLPLTGGEMLLARLIPFTIIGTVQGLLVLAAGVWLFHLPTRGSVSALIALLPLFAAAHFTLGYAIAARAQTQLAGLQGAVAFYLPAMLLSGFLYPFETLPRWAQMLGNVFPLTHFIRAAREALLLGGDTGQVLAHAAPILVFLAVTIVLGLSTQSRRLN